MERLEQKKALKSIKRAIAIESISALYIILFIYTGISKLKDYSLVREQISESPLLAPVASYIAFFLPWLEFAVAIALVVPRWRLKGLYAALSLMVLFTCYIITMLSLNEHIPCSCGGVMEELSWSNHIIFNSIFIGFAVTAILLKRQDNLKIKSNF